MAWSEYLIVNHNSFNAVSYANFILVSFCTFSLAYLLNSVKLHLCNSSQKIGESLSKTKKMKNETHPLGVISTAQIYSVAENHFGAIGFQLKVRLLWKLSQLDWCFFPINEYLSLRVMGAVWVHKIPTPFFELADLDLYPGQVGFLITEY